MYEFFSVVFFFFSDISAINSIMYGNEKRFSGKIETDYHQLQIGA
jgi:hypothetical protein